jgi:hypothetical protein
VIVISLVSSVFLIVQDIKTKTIHLLPLTIFIISILIHHYPKAYNIKQALLMSLFYLCLHVFERKQKKVYLGLGDVFVMFMMALIFNETLFYVTLCLSSLSALLSMTLTKKNIIAFIPSLILSFWSVYLYEIFTT